MKDGTEQAIFYSKPIHVFNEETKMFDEVDKKVIEDDEHKHLVNGKNGFIAKFSQEENNDELFSIENGMHRVTVFARKNQKNKNKSVKPVVSTKFDIHNADVVNYSNIEASTDYEYSVEADGIKENIVIKEKMNAYRYPFILKCENVTAKLDEQSKRIAFFSKETGEEVFYIPAPFMMDATGKTSDAVSYEMRSATGDDVYLTISADGGWLNEKMRAFPVVIDPQIKLSENNSIVTYGWIDGEMVGGITHTVGSVACVVETTDNVAQCDGVVPCDAAELRLNSWVNGSITYSGEKVCYKFIAEAGTGNYTISTRGTMDTVGVLYDANGCEITRNDDYGGLNFSITKQLEGGQTYYIQVGAYSTKTGSYSVGVTFDGVTASCYTNNRLYMKLNMPSLPNNPRIKKAELKFFQQSGYPSQSLCNKMGLYHVTDEIYRGNCTPLHDGNLIDFAVMKQGSHETGKVISYSFDITTLVDMFNKGESSSYNLVLKSFDECATVQNNVVLYGSEHSGDCAPQLVITYESNYGVNTSYRTHTHELGKFGQGSIDLQCGNLMFESEDFAWGGNRMPVNIKHLYNSALSDYVYTNNSAIKLDTADFSAMKLGKGFKLNIMQSIVKNGDNYIYIGENGDAILLKESKECVCCDSNTQCYPCYKPEDDSDMSYDYMKRILKQGDEVYQFNEYGQLKSITQGNNQMLINYLNGQICSVVDGAGREFGFSYTNGCLTIITAPDGSKIEYTYNGDLLSSVTYPDGTKAIITYLYNKPHEIVLSESTNNAPLYKVEYIFNGERVESVTEYGFEDGNFVMGSSSRYLYSTASGRTIVETTEQADIEETENNVIKTVYTFDDDGNIISEYVYSEDTGNVGANGEESGINPHSGDGGAGVVSNINNLLMGHSFDKLDFWSGMACNCDDIYINNYANEAQAKFGKKVLRVKTEKQECAENGVYQVTKILPTGEYTLSAYAKVVTGFTDEGANGAYIRVTTTDGTVLAESEHICRKDSEFIRLVAPFELATAQSVIVQLLVNGKGTVYFDAPQLENNSFANAYNMLENGNFELDTCDAGWNMNGAYYTSGVHFNMERSMYIVGELDRNYAAHQKVCVKTEQGTRESFTLSGWAKGWGLPTHERAGASTPTFRLRAVVMYSNNDTEEYMADFSPCTEEWQLASVEFTKRKYQKIKDIEVFCEYGFNSGIAYFDDIQLIRNSIETNLTSGDFETESEETTETTETTASEAETETTTEETGFKELTDTYGNTLTETTFTDGEFGTIYRAFKFNADTSEISGDDAGNNLISETDARGNTTKYTVDEDTSRNEEVIDRCGNKTAYEYDESGRTTKVTSLKPRLDENENVVKDTNGDIVYEPIANVSYAYDSFDNLTQIVRGDGLEYALKYNAFHNLESIGIKDKEDGELIKYTYKNGNGRLKEMTYANGDKMKATYNGVGQMVAEKWYNSSDELTAHYKYVYDGQGNIVRSLDILGQKEYNYEYEEDRLLRATECDITVDANEFVVGKVVVNTIKYYYDLEGNQTKKVIVLTEGTEQTIYYENTDDDNVVVKFSAGGRTITSHSKNDSFGRKAFDELQLGTGFVSRQFSYHVGDVTAEHAENGKLKSSPTTQLVSQIVLSGGRTISYEYDCEERITKVTDSIDGVTEYTYDELGQLLTETVNNETVNTMVYDNHGNIVLKNGTRYKYDNVWKDLLTSYNGKQIVYDAQGNPTSYLGHTLTWEKGRQLKSFDGIQYNYDINGTRVNKIVNGVEHIYTFEDSVILREVWGDNTLVTLYDNEESICGILYNNEPFYFQKNLQGDIIGIVDKNADVIAKYSYDAWGVCTVIQDISDCGIATINPFRYRSYYYDSEIQMYYLQSRYYNPIIGRFLNADEISVILTTSNQPVGANVFVYCNNNLVNSSDPTGYQPAWAQAVSKFAKGTLAYKTFLYATQKGWFSSLFWAAGFFRTSNGVYHTRQDCWQRFFGYNNFYDWAFNLGTSMSRAKFPFFSGNKEYIFWAWKGDYLNLGAGAELGIYSKLVIRGKSIGHWVAETKSALPMSMTLKYKKKVIATYSPSAKQWWITCFNPYYQNVRAKDLTVAFSINFASNKTLFSNFYNKYAIGRYKSNMWKFDKNRRKATLNF